MRIEIKRLKVEVIDLFTTIQYLSPGGLQDLYIKSGQLINLIDKEYKQGMPLYGSRWIPKEIRK